MSVLSVVRNRGGNAAAGGIQGIINMELEINKRGKEEEKNRGKIEEIYVGREGLDEIKLGVESLFFDKKIARKNVSLENLRWLSTGEAAEYLRVSVSAIKMMIYRGRIRVHKLGRRNLFLREELERIITQPVSQQEV